MASVSDQIVSFGKYKGQSLHKMLADQSYMTWVKNTPGMWEKVQTQYNLNVVNIVSNVQNADQPTPKHNKLQNKFLSESFVDKYLRHVDSWVIKEFNKKISEEI